MNGIKEILIIIQHWVYRLPDQLTVFTGVEAQYDTKHMLYRESQIEHKLVAESVPELADACREALQFSWHSWQNGNGTAAGRSRSMNGIKIIQS